MRTVELLHFSSGGFLIQHRGSVYVVF
jgi:hypothetical protein